MKKYLILFLVLLFCPILVFAEQIDINSATLSQLDGLTGIGPKYAQAIIDSRPYASVDDLLRVKGIGPATLQKIKNQGWACVNCQTSLTTESPATNKNSEVVQNTTPDNKPPAEPVSYPSGVFINEILPNPKGSDGTDEWIEMYNSNNSDVDLSGWKIQDTKGTITNYTIPQNTKILATNFFIFKRPDTKIMLNNDGDGLNLLTPDGKTEDSASFTKAPLGQSYNKTSSDWKWSTNLTPGAKNIIATSSQSKPTSSSKTLPKTKISDNNKVELTSADLSLPAEASVKAGGDNPWFLFFTALVITIILASVLLFIKLKFQKNVRT